MIRAWIKLNQILMEQEKIENTLELPGYVFSLEIPRNPVYLSYFLLATTKIESRDEIIIDDTFDSIDTKRFIDAYQKYKSIKNNEVVEIYLYGTDSKLLLDLMKKRLKGICDETENKISIRIEDAYEIYSYMRIISTMDCYGYYAHQLEIALITSHEIIINHKFFNEYYVLKLIESFPGIQGEEMALILFLDNIDDEVVAGLLPHINSLFFNSLARVLISYYEDSPSRYTDSVVNIGKNMMNHEKVKYYKDMDINTAIKIFGGKINE